MEFLRFFSEGGTKKEYFADYMRDLIKTMKEKYKNKQLFFVMDNLRSHTCSLIWELFEDK